MKKKKGEKKEKKRGEKLNKKVATMDSKGRGEGEVSIGLLT